MGPDLAVTVVRASERDRGLAAEAMLELHELEPLDEAALVEFLSDPGCYLLLAIEDGQVAGSLYGYALARPDRPEPQFLLYEIDVREEFRGRRIGTALVQRFFLEARAAGAFEVWVVMNASNQAAMALYRSCGLGRENPDDVMFAIALERGQRESR
jgi:ribosomal protein S18 acetylase RimI-like enzyme